MTSEPATNGGSRAPRLLEVALLGRRSYAATLRLQHELVSRRAAGEISDRLLLLEHDPVVTIGRGAGLESAAAVPFPVVEVERGGEATFHGPGQLVGYPILGLEEGERDLHRYLRNLEEVLIRTVSEFGLEAGRCPPHTGVWVGQWKVAAIGVAVRRWVTYHGFALNVCTDLSAFDSFQPCGLPSETVSSLDRLLEKSVTVDQVLPVVVRRFAEVFDRRIA